MSSATGSGLRDVDGVAARRLDDVAPARLAICRWAGGGIIRSSVATRYQLGLLLQAGSVTAPPSAVNAPRNLRVGHERGLLGSTSAANEAANLALSRNRKPSCGRQDRRHGRARRRIGDQRVHRLALVRREGRDVDERRDLRIVPASVIDDAAIGMADQDDRAVLRGDGALGDGDVVGQRDGRVLDDADV